MTKVNAADLAQERERAFAELTPRRTVEGTVAEIMPSLAQLKALCALGRSKKRRHDGLIAVLWVFVVGAAVVGGLASANGPTALTYSFFVVGGFAVALQLAVGGLAMLREASSRAGGVLLVLFALVILGFGHEAFFTDPIERAAPFFSPAGAGLGLAFGLALRGAIVFRKRDDPGERAYRPFAWTHAFLAALGEHLAPQTRLKLFGYEMADDPYAHQWSAAQNPPLRQRAADLTIAFDSATALKVVADVEIQHRVKRNARGKTKYKGAITRVELTISYAAPSITAEQGAAAAQWVEKHQEASWSTLWEKQVGTPAVKAGAKAKPGLVTTYMTGKYKALTRAAVMVDPPDAGTVSRYVLALARLLA